MLRDFVHKLKASGATGLRDAEVAAPVNPPSPVPAPAAAAVVEPAPAPSSQHAEPSSSHSVLGRDVEIKGSIRFSQGLVIDGKVTGDVSSDGILTVGPHGVVEGEIKTRSVILFGHMEGNITTQERCELKNTATLIGDISAGTLTIQEGATFIGQSRIGKRADAIKAAPAQTAKPLEILHGPLPQETPTQPAAVAPTRQAA